VLAAAARPAARPEHARGDGSPPGGGRASSAAVAGDRHADREQGGDGDVHGVEQHRGGEAAEEPRLHQPGRHAHMEHGEEEVRLGAPVVVAVRRPRPRSS